MCGINGIYSYNEATNSPKMSELLATRDAMLSRGPDGAGAWWSSDQRCGMAHRRLSIIDLSERANQPMISDDGRLSVVFNGEIYNYPELRARLESQGIQFRTTSDTEILLHLYARDRDAIVHELRGMYAFAIWDDSRRGLFLARDPYGIKPLYTANDGWTMRFASQVKALIAGGHVSHDPEPAGLVGFYLFGYVPEPFTLYREIRALPAGHTQWIDAAGPREPKRFANLAMLFQGAKQSTEAADTAHRMRAALLDSVSAHLLSDVEVGIFLSAGIDSGSLLGLLRDAGQQKVRAITLGFDEFAGTAEDEVSLAAEVARNYDAEHIVYRVSEHEFQRDLPSILEAMDQPSIDGINTWFVSKAAKKAGLKVALSGLGGDELLAGYASFNDIPKWRARFAPIASIPFAGVLTRKLLTALAPSLVRRVPKAAGIFEHTRDWPGTYLLRRALFLPHELPALIGADATREGWRRLRYHQSVKAQLTPDPGTDVARVSVLEAANYMRNQLLRDADWAGMAHSIEIRVPLVDWRLTSTLAPDLAMLVPRQGKTALAFAPSKPLPESVRDRAKTGFLVPTSNWIRHATGPVNLNSMGLVSRNWSKLVLERFAVRSAVWVG
jgi:asparagine synthase (glutamine-hydrolysing)